MEFGFFFILEGIIKTSRKKEKASSLQLPFRRTNGVLFQCLFLNSNLSCLPEFFNHKAFITFFLTFVF